MVTVRDRDSMELGRIRLTSWMLILLINLLSEMWERI